MIKSKDNIGGEIISLLKEDSYEDVVGFDKERELNKLHGNAEDNSKELTNKENVCPNCDSEDIKYKKAIKDLDGDSVYREWFCPNCGVSGKECYKLVFVEHKIDLPTGKIGSDNNEDK